MKITINNFNFYGKHIDEFVCDLPQVKDFDALFEKEIIGYIIGSLEEALDWNESFE